MTVDALVYVEVDVPRCSLTYAYPPCRASLDGVFEIGPQSWNFQNTNDGFSIFDATLTPLSDFSLFDPSGATPALYSPSSLDVEGGAATVIRIDVQRLSGRTGGATWRGVCFYALDGGHSFSGSYYKGFADFVVGERRTEFLHMDALSAGGTDWVDNVIDQVRFDFDTGTGGGNFAIYSVDIGTMSDGAFHCFNTLKTCQDRGRYTDAPVTLRFSEASGHYPKSIEALTSLQGVSYTPAVVSLGENLGTRASLTATFKDHPHSDTGPAGDKYLSERTYDPFTQGTFWGKFRGRHRSLRGKPMRFIQGHVGQTIEEMETRHFLIESFSGPSPDGMFTITAKDALKFADGDRSQAPVLSNGFLNAPIDDNDTSLVLSPSGIGNLEYPASGHAALGGKEIVSFTRSGDTLTLTRAQFNTEAVAHDTQDRVQLCIVYEAETVEYILRDLFTNYAGLSEDYIPYISWEAETASKLGQLYSACLPEPTGVDKLASELVEVCGLAVWWDDIAAKIRLQVLGPVDTDAALFDRSSTIADTFDVAEQPNRRISQAWVHYAQNNPLKKVDDADNYRSCVVRGDSDAEVDYGSAAIKKIFARWIPDFGQAQAIRVGDLQLGRFVDAPRAITLAVHREHAVTPELGGGYQVKALCMQDAMGAMETVPIQVTRLRPEKDRYVIEAQEMLFTNMGEVFDPNTRSIIISADRWNVNLRDAHDVLYPEPVDGNVVNVYIEAGVTVYSLDSALPAIDTGTWPAGVELNLYHFGYLAGAGGEGGASPGGPTKYPGEAGGTALKVQAPINLYRKAGSTIAGGGGGGGGGGGRTSGGIPIVDGGGGGGAGRVPGAGGYGADTSGTGGALTTGGIGGDNRNNGTGSAGNGGDRGQAGTRGYTYPGQPLGPAGGAAGPAIDGIANVTVLEAAGDIYGPQV